MENRIIFFSGGLASFAVAEYVKQNYCEDNILLLFTDTLFEDEDLYRFIEEASDKLKLPMLTLTFGMNPLQLMDKQNFVYNSRTANCSRILKSSVAKRWIKSGKEPIKIEYRNKQYLKSDKIRNNPILYFGIGFEEEHRKQPIVNNWKEYRCEFPLIERHIDKDELLKKYDIKKPRLYSLGFTHNNCKGRCIKGGQAHWVNLLETDYKSFCEMRDFELEMNKKINELNGTNKVYAYIKREEGNYLLKDLESDYNNRPDQLDLFDIGGCGCFVENE